MPVKRTPGSLWRFAARCVIYRLRQQRNRTQDYFSIPTYRLRQWERQFKAILTKLRRQEAVTPAEVETYDNLCDWCSFDVLCEWYSLVLQQLEQGADSETPRSLYTDAQELEEYQDILKDMQLNEAVLLVPPDYKWLKIHYHLSSGLLRLRKTVKEAGDCSEGLDFRCFEVTAALSVFPSAFKLRVRVEDCEFASWEDTGAPSLFCHKVDPAETLLTLEFRLHPQDLPAVSLTKLRTCAVEAQYSPQVFALLISFFAVPNAQEAVKVAAWDKLEKMQDRAQGRLTAALFSSEEHCVQLDFAAVVLKLPMDTEEEYLSLRLGRCLVRNEQLDAVKDTHEKFVVEMTRVELIYLAHRGATPYIALPGLQVDLQVGSLTKTLRALKASSGGEEVDALPDIVVKVALPDFEANLSYRLYQKLLRIGDFLRIDEEAWQAVVIQKRAIMRKAALFDILKRQGSFDKNWLTHFTVLSGAYLYFFSSPQAAFASSYFYIKDCAVQSCGDSLLLTNRYGTCKLAFDGAKSLGKWQTAIAERVAELCAVTGSAVTVPAAVANGQAAKVEVRIEAKALALNLTNSSNSKWARLALEEVAGAIKGRAYDTSAAVTVQKLAILDLTDAGAFREMVIGSNPEGAAVDIRVAHITPVSSLYEGTDLSVDLRWQRLVWNWSLPLLSALFQFFDTPSKPQPPATEVRKRLDLKVVAHTLELGLTSQESQITLALGIFKLPELRFVMRTDGYEFSGKFKHLEIADMTDYPKTAGYQQFDEVLPNELFTAHTTSAQPLSFHLFIPEITNPRLSDAKPNTVRMSLPEVELHYVHQPVCRLVEFYNTKLMGLFDQRSRVLALRRTQSVRSMDFGFGDIALLPDEMRKLTKLVVKLTNPKVVLTPRFNYPDCFVVNMQSLTISNTATVSSARHTSEVLQVDVVRFMLKSMSMTCNGGEICAPEDIEATLERLLNTEKAQQLLDADRSYKLDLHAGALRFSLEQAHYNLVMKLFDLNFTYDDHMDRFCFPESPAPIINPFDADHMGLFMQFVMELRALELTLLKDYGQLAEIQLGTVVLHMWKYNDGYLELDLVAQQLAITAPHSYLLQRNNSVRELKSPHSPFRKLKPDRSHSFTESVSEVICRPLSYAAETSKVPPSLRVTMKKQRSGEKEIVTHFGQLKVCVKLSLFFQLQYFFYYGLPSYESDVETPFDFMHRYRPQEGQSHSAMKEEWEPPKIQTDVYFDNPVLVWTVEDSEENLVSHGEVLFTYFRDAVKKDGGEYPATKKTLQCSGLQTYSCSVTNLESLSDFQSLQKKRIIEAVDITYESAQMARCGHRLGHVVTYKISRLNFLTTFSDLQLLYASLLRQSQGMKADEATLGSLCQITPLSIPTSSPELWKGRRKVSVEKKAELEVDTQRRGSGRKRAMTLSPTLARVGSVDEWDVKKALHCDGLAVIILNDRVPAHTHVLDFAVSSFEISSDAKQTSSMEHSEFSCRLLAFNPLNDTWEPLIEPFSLILQRIWNESELPETQWLVSVSNDATLDITASEGTLRRLYSAWKDWLKPAPDVTYGSTDVMSPFTVVNQTSLTLVMEKRSQMKSRKSWVHEESMVLEPGQSRPFLIDLQGGRAAQQAVDHLHFVLKDRSQSVDEFTGISLKRVHSEAREFQYRGRLCTVVIDVSMSEGGKLVSLQSPVEFRNDTDIDFWLLLGDQALCRAGEATPVPLHLCKSRISLLPKVDTPGSWIPVDLHDLVEPTEISAENCYFLLIPRQDERRLKTIVHISAPLLIRSAVPLPVRFQLQTDLQNQPVSHLLSKGETQKVNAFSSYDPLFLTLSFQNYMTSRPTKVISRYEAPARVVKMCDVSGEELDLYLDLKKDGNVMLTVYSAMVIINSTALPLTFYYKKTGSVRRIPGQLNPAIVLSDACKKLCLGLDRCRSRPFKTGAAGAINVITVDTEEDALGDSIRYQFVYNVEVAWLFPNEVIYTRVVTVTPRFIFHNALTSDLMVRQTGTKECCLTVGQGLQMPFYWPNGKLEELVQVTIAQEGNQYSWSGSLSIDTIGVTSFCCLPLLPNLPILHLRAEVKFTDLSVLVTLEQETERFCTYHIENLSTLISFCLYQECSPEAFQWLDVTSSIVFSWKEPTMPHKIVAEMFFGALTAKPVKTGAVYWFSPDKINDMSRMKVELTDELGQYITARTLNIGTCKVLRFYDSVLRPDDTHDAERAGTQVTLTIPRLGMSLVETETIRSSEIVYISFSRLELRATRSAISQQVELIIDRVQIDNQHSLRACFPVLLAPKAPAGHGKPTVSFKVDYHLNQSPNSFHVQVAEAQIQPLILQIESVLMVRLMALWERFVPPFSLQNVAFQNISTRQGPRTQAYLKDLKLPQSEKSFYVSQLRLHPLQITLSFLPVKDMDDRDNDTFRAFILAVGMVVSTIDAAPLELEAVEKSDMVGMQKQITSALWMSYRSQLASQLLSLIGHSNILGNPVGLLGGLGRGVADFFSEPAQGMRSGPLDAGIGLIKGAESLLKNTVSATFGSVSKLTGTMATGLSALTQDKFTLQERQRASVTERPTNVVQGVEMGMKSLIRNIGKGLAGVVTEPLKGAKKDGFTGLLSGSLKGIGGLVAQPVAGMFDMTSRTAEGIMNTANAGMVNLQRVRDPRVVYGLAGKLLPYRAEDAAVRLYIAQLKKGRYMHDHYVCHMQVLDSKNTKFFIVLSAEHLLLVLMHNNRVIFEIKCEDILSHRLVDKGLEVRTRPSTYKKTMNQQVFKFPIHTREMLERLHKRLAKVASARIPFRT